MFRASSAHLQEDIVVYKQHMVPSLSIRVLVACRYATFPPTVSSHSSCVSAGHQDSYREWRCHMLLVYNYVLLKMSTWCSKHVEESNILRINNSQYRQATRTLIESDGTICCLYTHYVLLKMSTWCSKHVEESNILRINNSQCIKLVINV